MNRARPLWMVVVALVASLTLAVAAGCGDDAEEAVDQGRSAATQAQTQAESVASDATGAEGGAETGAETGGATTLEIPAHEQDLAFQKEQVEAPAGQVTLRMPNPSPIPHNIAVDEPKQVIGEVVTEGGVSEITVDFPAGEYEYYCSVPGHREAGMVGTLTVE